MEWWMTRVRMMTEMSWEMDEEVNRDDNGEADGMNLEVDFWTPRRKKVHLLNCKGPASSGYAQWRRCRHIQTARRTCFEWHEMGATYPSSLSRGCIKTVLLEATETSWCWNRRLTLFLSHNHGVRLPSLASKSDHRRGRDTTEKSREHHISSHGREPLTERFSKGASYTGDFQSSQHNLLPDRRKSDIVNKLWQPKCRLLQ